MSITWHTSKFEPDRTCPICRPLEGHTWVYNTEKEPFPDTLRSPFTNIPVWDCVRDEPRPHGHHEFNCRCRLTVSWDFNDVEERINAIRMRALETCGSIEVWTGGRRVNVLRSGGRFVAWRNVA
jgi:hypothetical protein